jgi:hypothetical protein
MVQKRPLAEQAFKQEQHIASVRASDYSQIHGMCSTSTLKFHCVTAWRKDICGLPVCHGGSQLPMHESVQISLVLSIVCYSHKERRKEAAQSYADQICACLRASTTENCQHLEPQSQLLLSLKPNPC